MPERTIEVDCFSKTAAAALSKADLTGEVVCAGINYAYHILDTIDGQLVSAGSERLANLIELANLSSVVGNLFAAGIANSSKEIFKRNGPHKYPDLLHRSGKEERGVEVKVALEKNKPKGHLPKAGFYLTVRYVLGDADGQFRCGNGNRGNVVWIWEVKFGWLKEGDFAFSSTEGDSGKTAVIKTDSYNEMSLVFVDARFCPYGQNSRYFPGADLFH